MNEKVFRDPVHNYIHVDHPVIYKLINTKEFQRLRRIKQLEPLGLPFMGGEHSRFFALSRSLRNCSSYLIYLLMRNTPTNGTQANPF